VHGHVREARAVGEGGAWRIDGDGRRGRSGEQRVAITGMRMREEEEKKEEEREAAGMEPEMVVIVS
jgi:hypothetical protein